MSNGNKPAPLSNRDVQLVILNGSRPDLTDVKYYDLAYKHWHDIWESHFKERDGIKKMYSDNFTRQDEIFAFFLKGNCVGATCNRVIDLERQAFKDDSYFEVWDDDCLKELGKYGENVVICSQFSIEPGVPKFSNGVRLRDVIVDVTISHLRRCGFAAMTGTARKDKGMQESFALGGATLIKGDLVMHNGLVDVMAFYGKDPGKHGPDVQEISDYLWANRIGQGLPEINPLQPRKRKAA